MDDHERIAARCQGILAAIDNGTYPVERYQIEDDVYEIRQANERLRQGDRLEAALAELRGLVVSRRQRALACLEETLRHRDGTWTSWRDALLVLTAADVRAAIARAQEMETR